MRPFLSTVIVLSGFAALLAVAGACASHTSCKETRTCPVHGGAAGAAGSALDGGAPVRDGGASGGGTRGGAAGAAGSAPDGGAPVGASGAGPGGGPPMGGAGAGGVGDPGGSHSAGTGGSTGGATVGGTAGTPEGGSAGSTGGMVDRTPPTVDSATPAGDATGIPLDDDVSVVFSEAIDAASLTADSVQLRAGSARVEGEVLASANTVTFVPAASLALGTIYTVSLSTEITDLAGNPLAAPVEWEFTTRDGAWGTAQTITDIPTAFGATYGSPPPGLAVVDDGRAMAVWTARDAAGYHVEWSLFVPGQGWSAKQTIPGAPALAIDASLVSDGGGNVMALMQEWGVGGDLWAMRYTAGVGWDPTPVAFTTTSTAGRIALAGAPSGTALAAWIDQDPMQAWVSRFTPDGGWSEPTLTSGGACTEVSSVDVALNAAGEDIVVFAGGSTVCAHRNWSDPAASATIGSGVSGVTPHVRLDDQGNGVVAYLGGGTLFTSRCPAGAPCGMGSNLADAERGVALAVNGLGDTLALWPSAGELRASRFSWDAGWSLAVSVASGPGNAFQALAIERSGNATAVWEHTEGTRTDIWASRYTAGQQWSTAGAIETDNEYSSTRAPRVGVDAMGRATAVWIQNDGYEGPRVMYNRFE